MGNRKSLASLLGKYSFLVLIYTFLIMSFSLISIYILTDKGIIYEASYPEKKLEKIETAYKNDNLSLDDIPYYYSYSYYKDGKKVKSTIDKKYDQYVKEARKTGKSSDQKIIGARKFVSFKKSGQELILSYRLSPVFRSKKLYEKIENFELFYLLTFFLIWTLGFYFIVRKGYITIGKELEKISKSNTHIKDMNLDYKREETKYKEIEEILSSIDNLRYSLKDSLENQWKIEKDQKILLESITHDIRTPITLINGNLELLKEEYTEVDNDLINDIENGVERLNTYIDKLKNFSNNIGQEKTEVTNECLNYWLSIINSLSALHNRKISVVKKDTSKIRLDKENIAACLQNILINSIENSKENSKISLEFIDKKDSYTIKIKDEGKGFDENIIERATEKFVSNKVNKENTSGLGLYIVKDLVQKNKGSLYIENYKDDISSGAKVSMVFKKQ